MLHLHKSFYDLRCSLAIVLRKVESSHPTFENTHLASAVDTGSKARTDIRRSEIADHSLKSLIGVH